MSGRTNPSAFGSSSSWNRNVFSNRGERATLPPPSTTRDGWVMSRASAAPLGARPILRAQVFSHSDTNWSTALRRLASPRFARTATSGLCFAYTTARLERGESLHGEVCDKLTPRTICRAGPYISCAKDSLKNNYLVQFLYTYLPDLTDICRGLYRLNVA